MRALSLRLRRPPRSRFRYWTLSAAVQDLDSLNLRADQSRHDAQGGSTQIWPESYSEACIGMHVLVCKIDTP
jgi:hypothetical protein